MSRKMVFISGPRQVGKTTLARNLCEESEQNVSERYLKRKFPEIPAAQVLLEMDDDLTDRDGIRVCGAERFLSDFV